MARLVKDCPKVIGVKDATNDLARPLRTRAAIGPDFCQLSGEDVTIAAFLAQGGVGCISVVSNIAPKETAQLHEAWQSKDWDTFTALRDKLLPLHDAMFCEANPGPVKYAASLLGKCKADTRQPLWEISDASKRTVEAALRAVGLLS